jgi:hypothetical protein
MLRALITTFAFFACIAGPLSAGDLKQPSGKVILTVSGPITKANVGDTAQFDLEMLVELDKTVVGTSTIWTEGVQKFQGVELSALVNHLGITGKTLRAKAINDYATEIPVSDAVPGGPILAYLVNDKTMSVRNKGPLWLIYPYDTDAKYRSETIFSRSIWQLDRIEVLK